MVKKMWCRCEWISQLSPQHMWMLQCLEITDKEKPEITNIKLFACYMVLLAVTGVGFH
jgi:hypothetical protein